MTKTRLIQPHRLTITYLLTPKAGTSVGGNDNDEGQQQICTDDACYRPRLDPVARPRALWQTQTVHEQTDRKEWDGRCDL